jgi:hypothetical protein
MSYRIGVSMSRPESAETTTALLAALDEVAGLRPAAPARKASAPRWLPVDPAVLAVDLGEDLVEIRLIADALPLPPLLSAAEAACRAALADTPWAEAALRLVVVDLDVSALPG